MSYLELEPARAKARDPESLWESPLIVAEQKLNGWRYLMHLDREFPRVYLTGRRVSVETGFLSEKAEQVPMLWPEWDLGYTVLDGEIMPPEGSKFRDIAGIMNADVGSAQERIAVIGPPMYHVFDILFLNGEDLRELSWIERRQKLISVVAGIDHKLIHRVEQIDATRAKFDEIVAAGGEGVVLKDISSPYGEGWTKVKRYSTLDVIVSGFEEAKHGKTGKFLGLIGAMRVSVYDANGELTQVARVSGMDDDLRREISANREAWLGMVVEIRAQEWGRDRLLHPRFVRARPEARRSDCTFAKMMEELGAKPKDEECQEQLTLL